jgi:putative CocE/NonD family hydrolase
MIDRTLVTAALWMLFAAFPAAYAADGKSLPLRIPTSADDFVMQETMIPMRDGVKLYTIIVRPRQAAGPQAILLLRTPYDAGGRMAATHRTRMQAMLGPAYAELPGYIWVFQDIRGRFKSEGEYQAFRPLRGPFNATATDHTTDGWDTIEWLVKNVPENNGRVGVLGTSYEGWLVLTSLLDPHPALKAAVPVNPMVDIWMGDDAFHNGAFRAGFILEYMYRMEIQTDKQRALPHDQYDLYTWWLRQGSIRDLQKTLLPKASLFGQIVDRPAYDAYWQDAAIDRRLAQSKAPLVPTLHVHGWFDQEDIYGAPAAYAALEARGRNNDLNFFTAGPWHHGENWAKGGQLGPLDWSEATGRRWRADVLAPFLAHYLQGASAHHLANATVFNTGTDRWETNDSWPKASGTQQRNLYLAAGKSLAWQAPLEKSGAVDRYISDPASPVPYQPRPIRSYYTDDPNRDDWRIWHVIDQRFVDGRPDVLTYVSEPLAQPVTVRGDVTARLFAESTGTDADWVVKLIDVYPDQDAAEAQMSGYQLMISGEIFRGRYRDSFSAPKAIEPNRALEYRIRLPQVNHTFKAGHRLMVQVQSSWFPLYDRNPQTFVPSIMDAQPAQYRPATHSIHRSAAHASRIELNVAD